MHRFLWLDLEYDAGAGEDTLERLRELFAQDSILVEKKTKKGMAETDIKPMIRSLELCRLSEQELRLETVICAQKPSLNPQYLVKAVERYLPERVPDFYRAHRLEVYDENMNVFR